MVGCRKLLISLAILIRPVAGAWLPVLVASLATAPNE